MTDKNKIRQIRLANAKKALDDIKKGFNDEPAPYYVAMAIVVVVLGLVGFYIWYICSEFGWWGLLYGVVAPILGVKLIQMGFRLRELIKYLKDNKG